MDVLIDQLKTHPVPVLVTAIVIVSTMVPMAIAMTWWFGKKLNHFENGETKAHIELHGRIDTLEVLNSQQVESMIAQHNELKETVNRRFDDLKDYLGMVLGRSGPDAAKQQAGD